MNSEMAWKIECGVHTLQREAYTASRKAGWYNNPVTGEEMIRNVPEMIALIHSEVSEALEGYRKNLQDEHLPGRSSIEVELADVLIRVGDLANYLGLDLGGAVVDKMRFNETRADHKLENRAKQGGKKF